MDPHHAALVTGMQDETAEMPEDMDLYASCTWGRGQAAVCGRMEWDEHMRHALLCLSYGASAYVWAVQGAAGGPSAASPWQPDELALHHAELRDLMVRLLLLPAGQASRRPTRLDGLDRDIAELCGAGPDRGPGATTSTS